jgi:MSHA biogenesis protein MshG
MALYRYRAASPQGQVLEDSADAPTPEALSALLETRDLTLLSAREERGGRSDRRWRRETSLSTRDLAIFSRQMASLLKAGVTIAESLSCVSSQLRDDQRKLLASVAQRVRSGESLSEALRKHPRAFGAIYCATVAAAERVGALESAFRQLADMLQWERRLRKNLVSAIRYPSMVLGMMLIAVVVLQQVVVPQFGTIFTQMGANLPLATRLLIGSSDLMAGYWWLLLILAGASGYCLRRLLATEAGRAGIDRLVLRVPVAGAMLRNLFLARFARMLELLHATGLPILQALKVIQGTIGNRRIAGEVEAMHAAVSKGQSLAEAAFLQPSFGPLIRNMLHVGETSGKIDEAMRVTWEFYDEETTRSLQDLLQWIEPVLTVVLGAFVLFLALAIFLPWWDLSSLYRK